MATPATSSLGSLLALTGALAGAGAGAGAGQGAEPHQRLDPDYLDQYRRAFDEFDLDGDGKISTQVQQEISTQFLPFLHTFFAYFPQSHTT